MENRNTIQENYIDPINSIEWVIDAKGIKSCIFKNKRLPKTPAKILFVLYKSYEDMLIKDNICKEIFSLANYHTRRRLDLHVCHIRKFLSDSDFMIYSRYGTIKLCIRE